MQENNAYKPMIVSGILVVAVCLSVSLGLTGCEKEGGAEEAGRKMDQTTERMGNQLEATKESMDKKSGSSRKLYGRRGDHRQDQG
jgi:hyperosmotically inducible protein